MAKLNPRRRRKRQEYLHHGPQKNELTIGTKKNERVEDLGIIRRLTAVAGYRIPQRAFDLAVNVPIEIAEDKGEESKNRLRAAGLLDRVIRTAKEIEVMDAELEATKNKDQAPEVVVKLDRNFFGNDAHEKAHAENISETEGASTEDEPQS